MTSAASVTAAAELLAGFPPALRRAGLAVDAGRAADFLKATRLCRLDGLADLERIGRVTLAAAREDFPIYDSVFQSWFGSEASAGEVDRSQEDAGPRADSTRTGERMLDTVPGDSSGRVASDDVGRSRKHFGRLIEDDRRALAALSRSLETLPTTARRVWLPASGGPRIDLSGTARAARRTLGETLRLLRRSRPRRPRKLLLLIDVSGSMKAQSEGYLRFAHLATRRSRRVETFCFGTRLSRVSATLRHRDGEQALGRLADIVFDFDGGTLIGRSLEDFLSVSRYAALVRGAVTIVFSDGLERGDPSAMVRAVDRLARLSHRLVWATPLAADPCYRPATRGMAAILPVLDGLFDGSSLTALDRLLSMLDAVGRAPRGHAGKAFPEDRK
ncbi:vWA domain-containing protein [Mesorhizobium sp. L-8-3]|uniref:vWA domain-containing protein n=1 Tax=Mesorhizobium sp. L-8-3 TaxID=2744522 RepID=UPI00192655D9|nr:VWA domain-containing protein [Mesorhizobium sp. L-8-3]BCH21441.1 VWA containing CoxE family protein [Mesorhizobium sp. L-8-3]